MNFQTINCYSCGAPLKNNAKLCKCEYCRNYNLVQGGKTQIVQVISPVPPKNLTKQQRVLFWLGLIIVPLALTRVYRTPIHPPKTKVRLANGAIIEI